MQLTLILGRRLLGAAALIAAVLLLNFVLIHLAPGDPALTIAGGMGGVTDEILREIRRAYGLDAPLHRQLLLHMERILSGDLGRSLFYDAPVLDLILERLGPTVLLVVTAMTVALTLGTFMGVLSSRKPGGVLANLVTVLSLAGYSAPAFWVGIVLLLVFSATIPLFPLSGMYDVRADGAGLLRALDVAHHLVLPATTLAIVFLAQYSRIARASNRPEAEALPDVGKFQHRPWSASRKPHGLARFEAHADLLHLAGDVARGHCPTCSTLMPQRSSVVPSAPSSPASESR